MTQGHAVPHFTEGDQEYVGVVAEAADAALSSVKAPQIPLLTEASQDGTPFTA